MRKVTAAELEMKLAVLQAEREDMADRAERLAKIVSISNYHPDFILEHVMDLQRRTYRLQKLTVEINMLESGE